MKGPKIKNLFTVNSYYNCCTLVNFELETMIFILSNNYMDETSPELIFWPKLYVGLETLVTIYINFPMNGLIY